MQKSICIIILAVIVLIAAYSMNSPNDSVLCVENNNGAACLNDNYPYAVVPGKNQSPVLLKTAPEPLMHKLPVVRITYQELIDQLHHEKQIKTHHHFNNKNKTKKSITTEKNK